MLNQRAANLLQVILSSRVITIKQLEKKLNCTRRQVNYDLQKVNNWLSSKNLSTIDNNREKGLAIEQGIKSEINELLQRVDMVTYIPSQIEKKQIIFIKLFIRNDYLSVNHFTELIQMSRNTILSYIQVVKEELKEGNIKLSYNRENGYELLGDEFDIRALAFKYITQFLQSPNGIQMLEKIYEDQEGLGLFKLNSKKYHILMHEIESSLGLEFVDERLKELTIFFLFLFIRVQDGNGNISLSNFKKSIKDSDAYLASEKLVENLSVKLSEDEVTFIAMHLLGLNTSFSNQMVTSDKDTDLYKVIDQMIIDFQKLACVTFTDQEHAKRSLFMHIKPAYYRMLFKIPISNPYLENIKQEYFDLFILVKKSLSSLEELLECFISDDEVGYISLHIGAFLKNEGLPYRRRRCVIICPNGIGTSYMLKSQMEQLMPEVEVVKVTSPRGYQKSIENDIDFILSTLTLKTPKPLIIVSPIMTSIDKAKVLQEVDMILYEKRSQKPKINELMRVIKQNTTIHNQEALYHAINEILVGTIAGELGGLKPMLNDLLTKDTIQVIERVDDWKEAIRIAARPLLEKRVIEDRYIDAMINNVEKIGPYIILAPKVAVPHARPEDGVNKVGMSLLKIDFPVSFDDSDKEKDANLIFVIAAVDNKMHLKALSQLVELIEEEITVGKLVKISSIEEFIPFIEEYSH